MTELYVEHFVLIESLRLQFGMGLHVFTGETGAGKSLLLDATRLVLGGRASSSMVQRGRDRAVVEAVFDITDHASASSMLRDWDIDTTEGTVVVVRSLYRNGRTTCRVNGRTITVQMLKALGDSLVEMQGQHESHALLTERYQRQLVDLYGHHQNLCEDVRTAYRALKEAQAVLEAARLSERDIAQQTDMLRFQIEEIERANVKPGEEVSLRDERQQLLAFDRLRGHLDNIQLALEDVSHGAIAKLSVAESEADELISRVSSLTPILDMLRTSKANAEEAAFTLSRFGRSLEVDPERQDQIEERLVLLRALTRKYGATSEEVVRHLAESRAQLQQLLEHDEVVALQTRKVEALQADYALKSTHLYEARIKAAASLEHEVEGRLHDLRMVDARFCITIAHDADMCTEDGGDDVHFMFSGNPGESLMPIQKVASGGELSRTLLALKVVVADLEQIDTLIFDEIDTGVSGDAALRVAELLRSLGERRQVLCVTHSAQVSAAGHEHFQIVKSMDEGRVQTRVYSLDTESRTKEVGRLLGAGASDETALQHAEALLSGFSKKRVCSS